MYALASVVAVPFSSNLVLSAWRGGLPENKLECVPADRFQDHKHVAPTSRLREAVRTDVTTGIPSANLDPLITDDDSNIADVVPAHVTR
jgi:hypothetical protein